MTQASSAGSADGLKFENALAELENIVQTMENGQLELESSIEMYGRGVILLKHCQHLLADAEQRIQILENGELRDFEPGKRETP
jgi:exodeoxyribonuclease VII small subunit